MLTNSLSAFYQFANSPEHGQEPEKKEAKSKMKTSSLSFLLASFLFAACSTEQANFQLDTTAVRAALVRGEVKEALAFYEARAQEAEKNAASSSFPQQYWEAAANAYDLAERSARSSGQLQKSITYATKFLESAEKANSPALRVSGILALVNAYESLRNFDKAREFIEKGFDLVKQVPLPNDRISREGILHVALGRDLVRRKEYEKAIDAFSQGLYSYQNVLTGLRGRGITRVERQRSNIIQVLNYLGGAYRLAGQQENALKQYQQAFNSIREWSLKSPYEDSLYRGMAEIYLQQKNFPQALENFQKSLALAETQQTPADISSASARLGDILRQTGKPAEAIAYYQKAIQQVESTRSLLQSGELRQSYFEGALNSYVSMIDALLAAGKADDAFNYSERARSRVFLDILGSKVQLSRVKSGLLDEERALQERIASIKARLSGEEEAETNRASLRQELDQAEQAYSAFLTKVRKEDKEQASLMAVEPLTIKQVQEMLEPGVTMLEYFVSSSQVFLWVVDKERLDSLSIPVSRKDLASKVSAVRDSISQTEQRESFRNQSQEIYKLLLEPALPHIQGKELLVIPHDVLHYLPFQALVSPQGKYLIQDYPINYLSSASLMQFTKEKRGASRETALALGNPSLGDEAYNLRFAEREARGIAQVYPKSAVYLKEQATKLRAISLSPQNDILHFAVHAEFNEEDPMSSGLLLAREGSGDGKLKVGEIFSMNLKADLVVLSACETGLGKISSGDEIIGLTRAFIYAGTPSVITTLWKVNDQASYELMREFYSNLKTKNKSDALRQAQLKTMKEFPEPFFWAAYELTGEP
jgi:CHAT domain-containing protein